MASPFSPAIQAVGVTLGVDMSSVGEQEVELLKQLLVVETAIAGGGGGGGGITALTGDVTASGSGSVAATVAKIQGVAISGAAAAGNVLTASGAAAASWQAPSGGGTPGLPVWTFAAADSSDPASGKFTTDNASQGSTGTITVSQFQKGDVAGVSFLSPLFQIYVGSMMVITGNGQSAGFLVNSVSVSGPSDAIIFGVQGLAVGAINWSGDYQVTFWPNKNVQLSEILTNSSIAPVADGTVTPVTSITTQGGIVTVLS